MFKALKNGRRNASGSASSGSGRISGLHGLRGAALEVHQRRRPAFLPDTPEEQTFDSKTSRVNESI